MEKKRKRFPDSFAVIAGMLILLALGLAAVFCGGGEFSDWERRYLANRPAVPDLNTWTTDRETEDFLSDHIPGRQALIALDSSGLFLTGRDSQLSTWYTSGSVIEPPVEIDTDSISTKLRRFEKLAGKAGGVPWYVLSPHTHGWLLRDQIFPVLGRQYRSEATGYAVLDACENYVPMPGVFDAEPDGMYYTTDHHWTLQGAWQAYLALSGPLGYKPLALEDFRVTEYPGFRGTTLSRSGLPAFWEDTLVCAEPDSPVRVTFIDRDAESAHDRLIFPEDAGTWDGYAVYLHGNHGTLIIERPDAPEGTLVVFKDSMANCLLPLLSAHFRRIIAVDARYCTGVFSDVFARSEDTKAILFVYSLSSLVNDTEITRKAK